MRSYIATRTVPKPNNQFPGPGSRYPATITIFEDVEVGQGDGFTTREGSSRHAKGTSSSDLCGGRAPLSVINTPTTFNIVPGPVQRTPGTVKRKEKWWW